jgi:hypothetical protein
MEVWKHEKGKVRNECIHGNVEMSPIEDELMDVGCDGLTISNTALRIYW